MLIKSLRTEIALLALVSIFTASALILWFSMNSYENLYKQAASKNLDGLSDNLAVALIYGVVENDSFAIDNTLLELEQYNNVEFAAVFSEQGRLLNTYIGSALTQHKSPEEIINTPSPNFDQYMRYPLGMSEPQTSIVAKKRIGDVQSTLGYLVISNDLRGALSASKKDLSWSVFPWVVMTILLTMLGMFFFQDRALKPLTQLSEFMRKIRHTKNYSLVAHVNGKRELATLTKGLNSMMGAINVEVEKNKQKNELLLEQQAQLEKLANFDVLTGLPNRQYFMSKMAVSLALAKSSGREVTLMFFDVDGFKTVNDSFGHEIGDRLLCIVAQKISAITGKQNALARIGGDEFLVMLEDDVSEYDILTLTNRLIEDISQPVDIENWKVQIGISIGIAKASVADFNVNELIANADIAMYRAKVWGRNSYKVFTKEMIENSRRKLNIANAIGLGLSNNEFSISYQPKVDTREAIIGYEALARWTSPQLGNVSPVEFIPVAEQSGKINEITQWLIQKVCEDIGAISAVKKNLKIALNLSVYDLKNIQFFDMLDAQMKKYHVKPQQLEFEITESAYLDNFDTANKVIEKIKQMGSTIALDDFGTGYSSLSYLTQIQIDTLKIDKQFIDQLGVSKPCTLITKTIIQMAKHLNLNVCAEGIESKEQSELLLGNGCHILQGYYYGRPQPLPVTLTHLKHSMNECS